jgi:hypothetical protein
VSGEDTILSLREAFEVEIKVEVKVGAERFLYWVR